MRLRERIRACLGRARCGLLAALALAAGGVIAPSGANAQDQIYRGQTVNERPRPTYDAKGVPVGGFVLYPLIDVSGNYDDNIFAEEVNEVDDYEITVGPEARLQSRWSRHALTLSGFGRIHRFIDRTDQNTSEYGGNGQFRLDLGRDATLSAGGGYERRTIDRRDPEEAGRATPEQVDIASGSASFSQPFVKLRLTLSGDVINYDEVDPLDSDKNRLEYTGRARLGYDVSPAITGFVQGFYTRRDFDLALDSAGFNRDTKVFGGVAGLAYDITGILYGETSVGYYKTEFDDTRFTSDSGVYVDSKTTWNVTALTTLIARVSRENITTNEIIAGFASSSRRQVRFRGELQHELAKNILINADGGYTRDQFLEVARTDKTIDAGVIVRLFLDSHFSLFASYRYSKRDSNALTEEYTSNRVVLGLRAQV